ncbi:MAG: glycosyltransferase family 39 protein [Candidatus Omnitrophota bacterium]
MNALMNALLPCGPYILSFAIGYLLICLLDDKNEMSPLVCFFLAGGLGLALSSQIIFYQLLIFDHLNKISIVIAHVALLAFLIRQFHQSGHNPLLRLKNIQPKEFLLIAILLLSLIPLGAYARFFPLGGWDAWSVWNFKAKFILLGGPSWKNVFLPSLWQSSPHYPLLLPLVNVWGWLSLKHPDPAVPLVTAVMFTFLTAGLLFAILKDLTRTSWSIVPAIFLTTLPFFVKLATSQYCDIVFAYYLLATLYCILCAQKKKKNNLALLGGLFLGFLGFSKSEGTVAALIIIFLSVPYFLWADKNQKKMNQRQLAYLLLAATVSLLATVLFGIFYSPGNQTFINGLVSAEHPSNLYRLKFILIFLLVELKSGKWNGIWILIGAGILLSGGLSFKRRLRIIPLFLFAYLFVIGFYYFLNTYFEIVWWLQYTLNRILFSLLPTFVFWSFYSLWQKERKSDPAGSQRGPSG